MHLHRITLLPYLSSHLRAQRERKDVPYCCKPLPDRTGSVVVRLSTHLCPPGLVFPVGARKSKKLCAQEVPPDLAPRAPGFESESLKFLAPKLTSLQSRPGAVRVRHPPRRVQSFTILVFDCRPGRRSRASAPGAFCFSEHGWSVQPDYGSRTRSRRPVPRNGRMGFGPYLIS